jgi:hypothetical protein
MNHRPMQIIHDFRILSRHTGDVRTGLKALKEQGLGGVVANMPFHNYMQDAGTWKEFRDFIRACRETGMRVWIYDEKGYPSGFAGGQVLARRPELEATGLYWDEKTGKTVEARSYEGTHNCNNYFARARTANLLEAAAASEFIHVTHERYATELGDDLKYVEAFFTDEPALNVLYMPPIPAAKEVPVLDAPDPDRVPLLGVPWSAKLAERFKSSDLTGLFRDQAGAGVLRREFYARVSDELSSNFFGGLRTWGQQHGVLSSGHLLWEEDAANHTPLYGNFLRSLMQLDIPGIDVLSAIPLNSYRGGRRAAILAASAAMLNGTRRIFTESSDFTEQLNEKRFASVEEASAALAWQAALGVTEFTYYFSYGLCPELSDKTFDFMPSEQKKLARTPAEFLKINDAITNVVERLAPAALGPDVFLYYPIELMNAAYLPVLHPGEKGAKSAELVRIAESYHAALAGLLDAGVIPCVVDGAMLREARQAPSGGCSIMHATANAIVYPASCEPPADCRPESGIELLAMSPELPRKLFDQRKARIFKDNPEVCTGALAIGARTLVTLVNLTSRAQTCDISSLAGKIEKHLAPYEVVVEEL